eukprot:3934894-Rhodomonas_salina.3
MSEPDSKCMRRERMLPGGSGQRSRPSLRQDPLSAVAPIPYDTKRISPRAFPTMKVDGEKAHQHSFIVVDAASHVPASRRLAVAEFQREGQAALS